jgi:hypothetical protein
MSAVKHSVRTILRIAAPRAGACLLASLIPVLAAAQDQVVDNQLALTGNMHIGIGRRER